MSAAVSSGPWRVVFLCTGNSARSILGEVLLRDLGGDAFVSESAGSHPRGSVHPEALALLAERGHVTAGLRSQSWDTLAGEGAPALDLVITVCDNAAGETCPIWPGAPVQVHWGLPDPAAEADPGRRREQFAATYDALRRRIERLVALPFARLDAAARQAAVARIHGEP